MSRHEELVELLCIGVFSLATLAIVAVGWTVVKFLWWLLS